MKKAVLFALVISLATITTSAQQFEMWGTTSQGGTRNKGAIFKFSGSTGGITAEYSFDGINGDSPSSTLIMYNNEFIGTSSGGKNGGGVIFSFNRLTGAYKVLHDFENSADGQLPNQMIQVGQKLYGTLYSGGSDTRGGIFEYDLNSGIYTKKLDFDTLIHGGSPYGTMVLLNDKLYGQTWRGGQNHRGTIFEWDPSSNDLATVYNFKNGDHYYYNESLSVLGNRLFGIRRGTTFTPVCSYFFSIDPVVKDFKFEFEFTGENEFATGNMLAYQNIFYGMYAKGIFKWDSNTKELIKWPLFSTFWTDQPKGNLVLKDGKLYGLCYKGGTTNDGTIFQFDPVTITYVERAVFDRSNGAFPMADLTIIGTPSSIKNIDSQLLSIFPNPASDRLVVSSNRSGNYTITDQSGRVCIKGVLSVGTNTLDIHSLESGSYIFEAEGQGSALMIKE